MNKKILFLIAGIVSFIVFIGYLGESEPHKMLGYSINIWVVRLIWLVVSVSNFTNYFKIKKSEKLS